MKKTLLTLLAALLWATNLQAQEPLPSTRGRVREPRQAAESMRPPLDKLRPGDRRGEQPPLRVETFRLSNGLKVIVAEEHSQPKVFGAVIVHAGSKNEDPAATGVAHYFEHIMFKGTDRIGTTDWEREKPYLDSISDVYDRLQATRDEALRHEIQLEINRLNIEASRFAIANETDAILQQMGCTGLNAGTTYDYTVYYNTLPSNQLGNWMEVYAERFRNPVYRLFQGELEAVYEERNLYANEMMYTFSRNIFTESFGEHPYSRDIIGLDEHLKNPQPSAMKRFYDKYYVASNMTLLLVGDLDVEQARTLAERHFSIWPTGKPAKQPTYQLPRFDKQVVKTVKQTPIKAGLMIFPGVKSNDRDELALEVMGSIISGGNGYLDELATEGKLMAASLMPLTLQDAGTNIILYVPKLLGQKHEAAEELIWAALDSVKEGHFSDKLLESIKMNNLVARKRMLEDYSSIASLLETLEASGSDYEHWLHDQERLQHLTKKDIMEVARRYFDRDHCTLVRSSMGFPDKESAIKPDWEHLDPQNSGASSPFARRIAERQVEPIKPQVLDFKREVAILPVGKHCQLYASRNPKNDLFSLDIAYHYGTFDNTAIEPAVQYFGSIGADQMTPEQYNIEMDCLGGSFSISTDNDYTYLHLSGPESNLDRILDLAMLKLRHPRHDDQQIKNLVENMEAAKKAAKNDASTWSSALYEYVIYGDQSSYLNHATIKEVKKMTGEGMMQTLNQVFGRDGYVTFVGNVPPERVADMLRRQSLVHEQVTVMQPRVRTPKSFDESSIYYCSNKQFLKSDIDFYMPSTTLDRHDRAACLMFNEYFGGGMNSIVFQEIREFRSLGYSTYGYFSHHPLNLRPAYLYAYLGTQCDKTNDGIDAMRQLMLKFPERKEKFAPARDYLISVRNSNYLTFRSIPSQVRYWMEVENERMDPRPILTRQIERMQFEELGTFHHNYIEGRPMVITISGNAKKFDLKALGKYGKVNQVKYSKMLRF